MPPARAHSTTTKSPIARRPQRCPISRGFLLWRLSNDGPGASRVANDRAVVRNPYKIGSLADLFDNLVGTGDLRNTSMASAALREFHGVAVGVMCAHRSFPWLFMRRFEKLNASCFQKLEQLIEMIRAQFNMNASPLFGSHNARLRIRGIHG